MPVNGFTVGKDIALVFQTPDGALDVSSGITDFTADPVYTELKTKLLSGETKHGVIPDGWRGSFKVDRFNSALDDYFANWEAGYYNGQNSPAGLIYETVTEADGSVTQWRYTGVVFKFDKAGDYSGDKKVEQSVSFNAARKIKVA